YISSEARCLPLYKYATLTPSLMAFFSISFAFFSEVVFVIVFFNPSMIYQLSSGRNSFSIFLPQEEVAAFSAKPFCALNKIPLALGLSGGASLSFVNPFFNTSTHSLNCTSVSAATQRSSLSVLTANENGLLLSFSAIPSIVLPLR